MHSVRYIHVAALAVLSAFSPFAVAQRALEAPDSVAAPHLDLPDSPGASLNSTSAASSSNTDTTGAFFDPSCGTHSQHAARLQMTIAPNEVAEPMPVGAKILGGIKDAVSPFSAAGWVVAAGWSHLIDSSPNYGTNGKAYAQRLGAAAARNVSETIFSESLFAPVFREDPRYFIMGKGHNVVRRAVYAATRSVVTRTDSGHATPNFSLLAGNAAGAALTVTYYPAQNTTFSEVARTFGGSVGGSTLGFVFSEFIGDVLQAVHLKKQ
jgi:hypothetical protein